MAEQLTHDQARDALAAARRGRREVIKEIAMPHWYWWSLALGWVGLGVVADLGPPWLLSVFTVAFGATHAVLYSRVRAGRRRTDRLMVRASTVGRHASLVMMGLLLMMAGVTVAASLLVAADGARHPVTIASVLVGLSIPLGGPAVMATIRRRAASAT